MLQKTLLFIGGLYSCCIQADPIYISHFSQGNLAQWQTKSFKGETNYKIVTLDKQQVLQAQSTASASSLYKEISIDLLKTPYLNWSWRVDNKLSLYNEQTKQGDDFSARIYLIIKGKWFFWQTKSLNYVWASNLPKGQIWANPFTGKNVMMLALRSNTDKTAHWYTEKRHALNDLRKQFGQQVHSIDAIAIMTDTDNSAGHALSYYKNIYFSQD